MEIKQLNYFITVAEELHFRNAALKLNMSQPPLSYQIRKFEGELGVVLFERNNRNVKLTKAGQYFYKSVKRIVDELKKEVVVTQNIHKGQIGNIVLGFSGSAVFELLPKIIKQTKHMFPNVNLDVKQLTTNEQVEALNSGSIDVGLIVPPILDENILTYPISKEKFVLCVPKGHTLSNRIEGINCSDLVNYDFIMTQREAGQGYYDLVNALCMEGGFTPTIVQTAKEQHTIVSLVSANIGIALVPESTANINNFNVEYLPINSKICKWTSVAWKNGSHNEELINIVKVIKQLRVPQSPT
ncbi:LysR family transcriptional regulator [Vibrio parahaemolyticus]